MAERPRRILVVEDEFLVALDLQEHLTALKVVCVGPVATVAEGLRVVQSDARLDAAILNVIVGGERIDPVCEALAAKGIPFAFATGTSELEVSRWADRARIAKPYTFEDVRRLLQGLTGPALGQ